MTDYAFDLTFDALLTACDHGATGAACERLSQMRDAITPALPAEEHYRRTQLVTRAARKVAALTNA